MIRVGILCPSASAIKPIPDFSAIGTVVWISPPLSQLANIWHYIKCKESVPQSLSACILVPVLQVLQPDYMALLHHMQTLRGYPTGTHLFSCATANGGRIPMRGIPCPVRISYDPIVLPPAPANYKLCGWPFTCCKRVM